MNCWSNIKTFNFFKLNNKKIHTYGIGGNGLTIIAGNHNSFGKNAKNNITTNIEIKITIPIELFINPLI